MRRAPFAAWSSLVAIAIAMASFGCSLLENVDDVVVGNGPLDAASGVDASDAGDAKDGDDSGNPADSRDAELDVVDAGADATVEEDRRWALWPVPPPTPTNYDAAGVDVVTDGVTGLHWQRTVGPSANLSSAKAACAALELGGMKGWRLPTRVELVSLLAFAEGNSPAINVTTFPSTPGEPHWTASMRPKGGVYVVDFASGVVSAALGSESLRLRCVHSP